MSNYKFWTTEEDNKIRFNKKENESWEDFAKRELPHRTGVACMKHARKYLNIKSGPYHPRKYFYNKDAWKNLTPESCYWGGFIAADGNLLKHGIKREYYKFGIDLNIEDKEHLLKLSEFVGHTGGLQAERKQKKKDGSYSISTGIKVNLIGDDWVDDLYNNFKITTQKTFTLEPPELNNEFLEKCYLMGIIDGDGSVKFKQTKYEKIMTKICFYNASPEISWWVKHKLHDLSEGLEIRTTKRTHKRHIHMVGTLHQVSLGGQKALALIEHFRKLPVPYLSRKWDKPEILQLIEERKETHPDKFLDYCY